MIIWKQWFTSVSDTGMEVYFKLAYFNEWSHSAVGQSAYVIMPNFAKLIAIPFPFKNNSQDCFNNFLISILYFITCQYKHHLSTDQIDLELGSHHYRTYLITLATVD